ncbi:MAG: amino acid deaminase [Burkholderiales bacterium]|nr:amino acid deaminase [Burkholderiales bacterium]
MLNLSPLEEQILLPGTKGLALTQALQQSEVGNQNWNVLHGDTSFPVAVLKSAALQNNVQWMRAFCQQRQIVLAPHGKTTMSPQLFDLQLRNGAWGMTLATVNQMHVAHRFGVKRVILANQLISRSDIQSALHLMQHDPDFRFYALCDSLDGIRMLEDAARAMQLQRPLPLLVELGFSGGRTGCRSVSAALTLAQAIHASDYLQLAGIEGYEGLMLSQQRDQDVQAVQEFLQDMLKLTRQADEENLFGGDEILISAGGSAYFDLVGLDFYQQPGWSRPLLPVLRSGCYVTHDHGLYHGLVKEMHERDKALPEGSLQPALEIWSMVQSRPERDLAILTMGKRDASYDVEMPLPFATHKPGTDIMPLALPHGCKIEKMNDQHAYLRIPKESDLCESLKVGDLVACGISHPCTTFDKWPLMLVVDDSYTVRSVVNTIF